MQLTSTKPPTPPMTDVPHLSLRHVSKNFTHGSSKMVALDDISLDIQAGEFVCLVGPSGCGKSTILKLIAGLDKPDSGEILVQGRPINQTGPDRLLLFQEPALFPWLDVVGNVEFGLKSVGVPRNERRERAMHYLRMVHLSAFAHSRVHQLSGGMRQRAAIARTLAIDPQILLMDEPFSALDAQTRDMLHEELQNIWAETGKTIIFVTHNVREAVNLGDRVVAMTYRPGRIKATFSTTNLPRPRHVEDEGLMTTARDITAALRDEVRLAAAAEYSDGFGGQGTQQ